MEMIDINKWATNHSHHIIPSLVMDVLPADTGSYILISGKTGIGKSILTLHLAFALATGRPFLGIETKLSKVAYVALEGGQSNWRDRIQKLITIYPKTSNLLFNLSEPMDLLREDKRNSLMESCKGCDVIIFDNLRQVTSGKYLDPNYAASWLKVYERFLRDCNAVGILTHHIKKKDNRYLVDPDDVYQLKGATEYVDAATSVLLLERRRQTKKQGKFSEVDSNSLTLYFAKSRIASEELQPIQLRRNFDICGFDVEKENE